MDSIEIEDSVTWSSEDTKFRLENIVSGEFHPTLRKVFEEMFLFMIH